MSKNLQILKFILVVFLGWKIILSGIAFFGLSNLPISLAENKIGWAGSDIDFWLKWANWDGGHFRGIAENGYLSFQVVFFPLYPLLIKALMFFQIPSLWGGLIISNLAIIGALFYLYKLVNLDFDESIAKKTIFVTLAFPTAFYFNAVYSESLFLLLTVGSFYYMRKQKWLLAFIFAGLATVTRLTGTAVILAGILEYYLKTSDAPSFKEFWSNFLNRIASYLLVLAISIGFIQKFFIDRDSYLILETSSTISILLTALALLLLSIYFLKFIFKEINYKKILTFPSLFLIISFLPFLGFGIFLYLTQNNFLAFIEHEQQWARHLTFPWTAPIDYLKNILVNGIFKIGVTDQLLIEFIFFCIFLALLILSYIKFRISYIVFFALSLLIPISTGTLQAIHRYGLVIFPAMILLAQIKNETYYQLWIFFSLTLLGILTVLFINSYWVS